MQDSWLEKRLQLQTLTAKMRALLEHADEVWMRGRANGDDVDYERFEEDVAQKTAEIECAVLEVALSNLNIDAAFGAISPDPFAAQTGPIPAFGGLEREHKHTFPQLTGAPLLPPWHRSCG